ncbi:MAG TPA: hypothetical protein VGN74_06100 [Brevundimonas sp.]|jgi:hypothetical protein|nr:hypothetical protein [Brevundimonas sp.]
MMTELVDADGQRIFAAISSVAMLAYLLVVLNRRMADRRREKQDRDGQP